MNKRVVKASVTLALLTIGFGCAELRDASKELQDARTAKDMAKIEAICKDESLGDPNDQGVPQFATKYTVSNRNARGEACREVKVKAADVEGTCNDVVERYEKAPKGQDEDWVEYGARWGKRFAKCGKYDAVFEHLAHVGEMGPGKIGQRILEKLEADGLPLDAEFEKYVASHQGPSFLAIEESSFAANHIGNWLDKRKAFKHCAPLAAAIRGSSEKVRGNILFYFSSGNCAKETNALGVPLLASDDWKIRQLACANLGSTGDAAVAKKVKIVADSDAFMQVVQDPRSGALLKEWTVREVCQQAYGKIQLRSQ